MLLLLVLRLRTSVAHGPVVTCSNYKKGGGGGGGGETKTKLKFVPLVSSHATVTARLMSVLFLVHAGCCS